MKLPNDLIPDSERRTKHGAWYKNRNDGLWEYVPGPIREPLPDLYVHWYDENGEHQQVPYSIKGKEVE